MPKNFAHLGGLNAYEILGVEPTATTDEIDAAYRAAIKRQHSDTGGVTRLAQLVNDARDALVKDRASYDAWLQTRPPVVAAEPDLGPAPSASDSSRYDSSRYDSSRYDSSRTEDVPGDEAWDPWETVGPPHPPPKPPRARKQPWATTDPGQDTSSFSADQRRRQPRVATTPLTSGLLDVVASVLSGPLGSRLGIRTYRRGVSAGAAVAIVIVGMGVLCLVSLAIAISLGVFREPSLTSSATSPVVMKQGQVVVTPGTKVVLDAEGKSFAPSDDHASLVGTESGLLLQRGTSHVALAEGPPERYDTCSALDYPEPTDKPIAWNRLTIGSALCVRTTYFETTKSLITVVDRSGRSATLKIITWDD
jgi:hypothetical protein